MGLFDRFRSKKDTPTPPVLKSISSEVPTASTERKAAPPPPPKENPLPQKHVLYNVGDNVVVMNFSPKLNGQKGTIKRASREHGYWVDLEGGYGETGPFADRHLARGSAQHTSPPPTLSEARGGEMTIKARNGGIVYTLSAGQLGPGGKLGGAHLHGCNLIGAELAATDLAGTDFERANLAGANLTGANLRGANLLSANLSSADLSDADLTGAGLAGAVFDGTFYSKDTHWPAGFDLKRHGRGAVLK